MKDLFTHFTFVNMQCSFSLHKFLTKPFAHVSSCLKLKSFLFFSEIQSLLVSFSKLCIAHNHFMHYQNSGFWLLLFKHFCSFTSQEVVLTVGCCISVFTQAVRLELYFSLKSCSKCDIPFLKHTYFYYKNDSNLLHIHETAVFLRKNIF